MSAHPEQREEIPFSVGDQVRFTFYGRIMEGRVVDVRKRSKRVRIEFKLKSGNTNRVWRRFDEVTKVGA